MHQAYLKNAAGASCRPAKRRICSRGDQHQRQPHQLLHHQCAGRRQLSDCRFQLGHPKTSYSDSAKGKAVAYLFQWLVTDGQSNGTDLQYAPLPKAVQDLALSNLKLIKAGGSAAIA
jgi:hypothetical protein